MGWGEYEADSENFKETYSDWVGSKAL